MGVLIGYGKKRLGILSDSRYYQGVAHGLVGCDVVVCHVGALLDEKQYVGHHEDRLERAQHLKGCHEKDCVEDWRVCAQRALYEKILCKKNHLYLPGLTRLLCELQGKCKPMPFVVLSEFGEELRCGLRVDLARRLEGLHNGRPIQVAPADVGLRIDVSRREVRCAVCRRYCAWTKDRTHGGMEARVCSPSDEGIAFVCSDCVALRGGELPEILQRVRATPKPLEKLPATNGP